jgi:hypothetical protein
LIRPNGDTDPGVSEIEPKLADLEAKVGINDIATG